MNIEGPQPPKHTKKEEQEIDSGRRKYARPLKKEAKNRNKTGEPVTYLDIAHEHALHTEKQWDSLVEVAKMHLDEEKLLASFGRWEKESSSIYKMTRMPQFFKMPKEQQKVFFEQLSYLEMLNVIGSVPDAELPSQDEKELYNAPHAITRLFPKALEGSLETATYEYWLTNAENFKPSKSTRKIQADIRKWWPWARLYMQYRDKIAT